VSDVVNVNLFSFAKRIDIDSSFSIIVELGCLLGLLLRLNLSCSLMLSEGFGLGLLLFLNHLPLFFLGR
jgi:hypothetical protein